MKTSLGYFIYTLVLVVKNKMYAVTYYERSGKIVALDPIEYDKGLIMVSGEMMGIVI